MERQTGIKDSVGGPVDRLGLAVAHRAFLSTDLCRRSRCVGGRGFIYASRVSALRNEKSVRRRSVGGSVAVGALAVRRGLQVIF